MGLHVNSYIVLQEILYIYLQFYYYGPCAIEECMFIFHLELVLSSFETIVPSKDLPTHMPCLYYYL